MPLVRRNQDTLTHFGISGQKWGVRRWQHPDGRFTEEGKVRYFGISNIKAKIEKEKGKEVVKNFYLYGKVGNNKQLAVTGKQILIAALAARAVSGSLRLRNIVI